MSLTELKKNEYFWLVLIIIVGFLIRLWFLDKRWINPDEGAHLMDGRLALDGLVPEVDYDSRQPLYVYIIALVLKIFGPNYIVGRFIPLISTLGIILFIFLIAKKMFDKRVGLLASAIYTFLPFSILWSIIVHTEPLTVLLNCIGVYCVISYVKSEKNIGVLVLGGVFFALAYYVRETSLAMLVAAFFYFAIIYYNALKRFIKNYGALLSGYFLICIGAFAYYSRFMSPYEIWHSGINPFNIVIENFSKILTSIGVITPSVEEGDNFRFNDQPWGSTATELISTFYFNSFLYVGLLFSALVLVYLLFIQKNGGKHIGEKIRETSSIFLLYLWFFSLSVFYSYWVFRRGFYMQYFEEFLPPLVILLAFVVIYSLSKLQLEKSLWKKTVIIGSFLATVFIISDEFLQSIGFNSATMGLYILLTIPVLAAFWFFPRLKLKRRLYASVAYLVLAALSLLMLKQTYQSSYFMRGLLYLALLALVYITVFGMSRVEFKKDLREGLGFVFVSLVVSSFVLSFALSGYRMHLGFASTWSPQAVREISDYIKLNSNKNVEVMSGGVIWEFEAGYKPFMNWSHPTAFRPGVPIEMVQTIEQHLHDSPPEFIVLDGYTEQTYLRHIKNLQEIIDEKYKIKKVVNGNSRYPVEVYELIKDTKEQQINDKGVFLLKRGNN